MLSDSKQIFLKAADTLHDLFQMHRQDCNGGQSILIRNTLFCSQKILEKGIKLILMWCSCQPELRNSHKHVYRALDL